MVKNNREGLDHVALIGGFVIGLLVGGLAMLFKSPRNHNQTHQPMSRTSEPQRNKLETVPQNDLIAESMSEGKAAAHRRRLELGLD